MRGTGDPRGTEGPSERESERGPKGPSEREMREMGLTTRGS